MYQDIEQLFAEANNSSNKMDENFSSVQNEKTSYENFKVEENNNKPDIDSYLGNKNIAEKD